MKNKVGVLLLIGFLNLMFITTSAKEITCTIRGKVMDSDSKEIILYKGTDDFRTSSVNIPIVNGSFEYKFTVPTSEVYALAFGADIGHYRPLLFFPEEGEVLVTVYPLVKIDKSRVEGGPLNQQLNEYQYPYNKYTAVIEGIRTQADVIINKGKGNTPESKAILASALPIGKERELFEKQYFQNQFANNKPSLVAYFLFTREILMYVKSSNDSIENKFSIYSKLYPNHPYSQLVRNKLESFKSIKQGGRYIDFTASDIKGNALKLSNVLKDEFTLVDLWSTWCGPCIEKSRSVIPIFNAYKDKGFNVIGFVRESEIPGAVGRALEREKYPWSTHILSLKDPNDTWAKYNLSFSGGGTFLLNKSGNIVAINPSADELQHLLQKELVK